MKDYYKNRVLTDFKPGAESEKSKSDEDDGGSADMSPTSLKEKDKDRKKGKKKAKDISERKNWNGMFTIDSKGPKAKYIK